AVSDHLAAHPFPGFIELVPAFTTVAVYYDPLRASFAMASSLISRLLESVEPAPLDTSDPVVIPVCYGGELGPDLDFVAQHAGITADEVVRIHAAGHYRVY